MAEATDLILELGMYSLKQSAEDLAQWQGHAWRIAGFHVGQSVEAAQLLKSDLCNDVIR